MNRRTRPNRLALGCALGLLVLLAGTIAAAAPSPLLGKRAPMLSGRAGFGTGLINLNKLQNEIVTERGANGQPVREGNRIKFRVVKHAVVLNFFATYCVPCVQEIPTFNRIAKSYEGKPVKFVYVNVDTEKTAEQVRDFARQKGIAVEMILPSVIYALDAYKIDALPRIVVVNADGVVSHVITGFQEDLAAQIGEILDEVLPGRKTPAKARKAG